MVFDKENRIAYIARDKIHRANYPVGLLFEQLFGEVVSECVVDELSFTQYIDKHPYISDEHLKSEFERDYYKGFDYYTNNRKTVNSKIYYQKGDAIHIADNVFFNCMPLDNCPDYFSTIIPEHNGDLYLYLLTGEICALFYNYETKYTYLDKIREFYTEKFKLSDLQKNYYMAGYAQYRDHNIEGLKKIFESLTGYKLIEKII